MSTYFTDQRGSLLVLVLVFSSVFLTILTGFIGYIVSQHQLLEERIYREQALEIAEAGLNYYKWYLAHNPGDVTNGTGLPGPYVETYADPEGGDIGEFSLEIASSTFCGDVSSIGIISTGHTYVEPDVTRTVYARYAQPTVAEYAYIINSNVWAGADRTIIGPYHSNGYIRMDGENNSTVTSQQEDWVCDNDQLNCDPPYNEGDTLDAVFGAGPNYNLWTFPAPPINFTGLTLDLAAMQDRAENEGGIYIPPTGGDYGYRLKFQNDNTVDVYTVDQTYQYWGYSSEEGWEPERNVIKDDDFYGTYTVNEQCPLIFVEDKVWLEGDVATKVSVAAADNDTAGIDPSIIINDNLTYSTASSGILAIAEDNVLIGLTVPDDMEVNGIFIAQNGHFGRNHYSTSGYDVLSMHNGYVSRNSLTINGTIVSNGRVGTKWVCGGAFCSGFYTRVNSYDRNLVDSPPPLAPNTSDDYRFVEWREEE